MNRNADNLQQFLDDLTPLEWEAITTATAKDWMDALNACVKDPTFWQGLMTAALQGVADGLENFNKDT